MNLKHISRVLSSFPEPFCKKVRWHLKGLCDLVLRLNAKAIPVVLRTHPNATVPDTVPATTARWRLGTDVVKIVWIVVDCVYFCGLLIWKWSVIDKVYLHGIYIILYLESMSHCKKWRMWMFKDSWHIFFIFLGVSSGFFSHGISSDINVQFLGLRSKKLTEKPRGRDVVVDCIGGKHSGNQPQYFGIFQKKIRIQYDTLNGKYSDKGWWISDHELSKGKTLL